MSNVDGQSYEWSLRSSNCDSEQVAWKVELMSENPFESPQPDEAKSSETFDYQHDGSGRTFVRQVSVVASLMIVQGALMVLFALFCAGYALFVDNIETLLPAQEQAEFRKALPEGQRVILTSMFGLIGGASGILSILFITAGCMNLGLHYRGFGIATLLMGLGTMLTCYCAITGVPLTIYGLIIYFNPAVGEAFRMRKSGMTKQEVLATFVR